MRMEFTELPYSDEELPAKNRIGLFAAGVNREKCRDDSLDGGLFHLGCDDEGSLRHRVSHGRVAGKLLDRSHQGIDITGWIDDRIFSDSAV